LPQEKKEKQSSPGREATYYRRKEERASKKEASAVKGRPRRRTIGSGERERTRVSFPLNWNEPKCSVLSPVGNRGGKRTVVSDLKRSARNHCEQGGKPLREKKGLRLISERKDMGGESGGDEG